MDRPETVAELAGALREGGYIADRGLATALFVAVRMHRPVLLEGEVGVGKTEVAKVLAAIFGRSLIRLQCYEGIDVNQALYEWDYARQMLHIRALSEQQATDPDSVDKLFGPKFLLERPLLAAIRHAGPLVLLVDETDKADVEVEGLLLELLSEYQITIPELGTIAAIQRPFVVLTSNATRELSEALKRRCLHAQVEYPDAARERAIVRSRVPEVSETLTAQIVTAVRAMRTLDLRKAPSVAETIDWARAVHTLGYGELDAAVAGRSLGVVLKNDQDKAKVRDHLHLPAPAA